MRLTAIILLSACLMASASGNTQSITISVKNASLEKVFEQIKKQTGYTFLYKDEVIKKAGKVNLNVSNVSVETALEICFKNLQLTYKVFDNKTIVIAEKETTNPNEEANLRNEPPPPIDITGKVTDENGNPLAGASVKVKNSKKGTTTNNDGIFILKGVDDDAVLEISFIGYEKLLLTVNNRTSIVASLKLNASPLDEIIIKPYWTNTKRDELGNSVHISSKEIEQSPVSNPLLAIQGRATGIEITQLTGMNGGGVTARIQGRNSINSGLDPLS